MMPKFILQFEGRVLKEYVVGEVMTIGRLPDNMVVIENPAVSGHHARIVREGADVILEDLESTNGTFVNEKHVVRHALQDGDVVLVGKHKLVFDKAAAAVAEPVTVERPIKNLGDTVYLDTKKHRAMLASLREARAASTPSSRAVKTAAAVASGKAGVLRVLAGRAEHPEYKLDAHTSLIGASDAALVRLHGWFKPKVAVAIARSGEGYVATRLGGRTLINSEPLSGRHDLKDGDILRVSGLTLEFRTAN
jgi:pSer/pThr/pTyr-binding forkhead associated (FHA) protein